MNFKNLLAMAALVAVGFGTSAALAGYDVMTKNFHNETPETASALDSNCLIPVFDLDADDDGTEDDVDANSDGDADFVTCSDVYGLGSDKAGNFDKAASADSATTNTAVDIDLTAPADTTGTNNHYGLNIDLTVGNATGGTNAVRGINIANVTGDAQVNTRGISIGTGTVLGTSPAISVGTGWDFGLDTSSPVKNTLAASADSATTNTASEIVYTTPVDTTGTNAHNGLLISPTIGNATGGTNTFDALEIAAVTGDAQVTEVALKIGSGYDTGIVTDSSLKVNSTNGTAISAIRIGTDTDLDNGQTSEVVTVTGATSASLCFATITNDSTTEVSVTNVVAGTDQATVQVSGDPGASGADLAVICYN